MLIQSGHEMKGVTLIFVCFLSKSAAVFGKVKQFVRLYLPSVPQHGVFGFWQLLTTDDLYH